MVDLRHEPPVFGHTMTYASTRATILSGVLNDWEYEVPPGTLAVPAEEGDPLCITSTVHVPRRKLWKVTVKPFVLEIDGTEMKGAADEVGLAAGLGVAPAPGEGVVDGDGVTSGAGSMT